MSKRLVNEKIIEKKHKELFIRKCPRPRDAMLHCLMVDWYGIIDDLLNFDKDIHKIISGKKGKRTVNLPLLDEIIVSLEEQVKERILETEVGINFLEKERHRGLKMFVYCILGCQKIWMEFSKSSGKLSEMKTMLLHELLIRYYLQNDKSISNSSIQEFEKVILRRKELKTQNKLRVINEEENSSETMNSDNYKVETIDGWQVHIREEEDDSDEQEFPEGGYESPLLFPRDKLRKLTLFDVDNYFLEGDEELTDVIQKICTDEEVENKRCITCDESHEFYSLASRKLIHLFIYKTDLFENINFNAECLLEEQLNVNELRRYLEIFLRREGVNWELTQEEKNKFVLCTFRLSSNSEEKSTISRMLN